MMLNSQLLEQKHGVPVAEEWKLQQGMSAPRRLQASPFRWDQLWAWA